MAVQTNQDDAAKPVSNVAGAMKRYIGFSEQDAENVRSLAPILRPALPAVADRFYAVLRTDPDALKLFPGGEAQLARQRETLLAWLENLLTGAYNDAHFLASQRIGETHVRISLPQHYMVTAMDIIRRDLVAYVLTADPPEIRAKLASLSKLLALELGAMLEAYKEEYAARIKHREREAMEERLTRAEHLAQLGQLAASLAHAIKNPLAGISGAIQIIRGSMSPGNPHRPVIDEILAQIDRLDATVKDLLVYSRPRAPARISIDLNELIARALNVLREEPTLRRIRVRHVRKNTLPRILADERQLEQVVMNLLLNAADASNEGEKVTITTSSAGSIRMEIADQGIGMDPDILQRAFEPFHTTKTKGTGLGLPICRQIVEAHGGRIKVESAQRVGTTVAVELPLDDHGALPPQTPELTPEPEST